MTPFPSSPHPPDVSHVFPEFPAPDLGSVLLQESITLQDVKALQLAYRRHCEVTAPSRWPPGRAHTWALGIQWEPQCPQGLGAEPSVPPQDYQILRHPQVSLTTQRTQSGPCYL